MGLVRVIDTVVNVVASSRTLICIKPSLIVLTDVFLPELDEEIDKGLVHSRGGWIPTHILERFISSQGDLAFGEVLLDIPILTD